MIEDVNYSRRVVDAEIDQLFAELPALLIEGPKGVGKTATALKRASNAFRFDDPSVRRLAQANLPRLLESNPPVLLDEWQYLPDLWNAVRRSVDADQSPGRFLLTGSASPGSSAPQTHSGAGRITQLRMRPLSLAERGLGSPTVSLRGMLQGAQGKIEGESLLSAADYAREIIQSGFPGLRRLQGRALRAQLDGYIARIIDRDFPEQGLTVRKPARLRAWMHAYAAATAMTVSYEKLRQTSGEGSPATRVTLQEYREILERLWILEPLPGWSQSRSQLKKLTEAPKYHLADPALAARLLGVDETALLDGSADEEGPTHRDGALFGRLFESLVTLSVRVYAQHAEARVLHLRTQNGRQEVDLIVERPDGRIVAIEVKLGESADEHDVKHLHWLREQVGAEMLDAAVITTGRYAYRRKDGIAVIPAVLLGP